MRPENQTTLSVHLGEDDSWIKEHLKAMAKAEDRSISYIACRILNEYLEREQLTKKEGEDGRKSDGIGSDGGT